MTNSIEDFQVLLADSDEAVLAAHRALLSDAGYSVDTITTRAQLCGRLDPAGFDVILLEPRLTDGSALDLIAEIRHRTSAGIIVVTANRDPDDRWHGLESGADDYLEKPVHPRDLLARLNNLIGRLHRVRETMPQADDLHRFEGWTADLIVRKIWSQTGGEVYLTGNEFRVLEVLIRSPTKPVHRDRLLAVLSDGDDITARAVDKTICRMRAKFAAILGDGRPLIKTIHGFGYLLVTKRLQPAAPAVSPAKRA